MLDRRNEAIAKKLVEIGISVEELEERIQNTPEQEKQNAAQELREEGEQIRKKREEKGYSVKHLAKLADVSVKAVNSLEKGDGKILITEFFDIMKALEYEYRELCADVVSSTGINYYNYKKGNARPDNRL